MFIVLYINLRHQIRTREVTSIHFNLSRVLHNQNRSLKSISKISEPKKTTSLTVDYLINSCGLSPKQALSISKRIHLSSAQKPDSIISFFQNHGLTISQITSIISKRPKVLLSDPDKILKPKIEFLLDLGVPSSDLGKFLTSDPHVLVTSLEKQLIPSLNFVKKYAYTDSQILTCLRRSSWMLGYAAQELIGPNIAMLQDHNVPWSNISKLVISYPRTLLQKTDRFKEIVQNVQELGFLSTSQMFCHAVRTLTSMSKLNWEKKFAIYQEFGWSENDILETFKKYPLFMALSDENIRKGLTFYMVKLKWTPADISLCPVLLALNLDKRIIPRCAVLQVLDSKGISREKMKVSSTLRLSDKDFCKKFVTPHQKSVPEVMKAFKGEIEFTGFE